MALGQQTPVSPSARKTMEDAFHELQRNVSFADRKALQDTTLGDVQLAADLIQNQLAARQSLRNMGRLAPLFDGLSHYSKSIEVLCNGTPLMPWIWAPIKVILKVASDHVEAFAKIIRAYARIAESLGRFKVFNDIFPDNINVQDTLAIFYVDILKFHRAAYKFVCRGGWKTLFLSSWGRFQRQFDAIFEDLQRHEDLIDKTANAADMAEAKAMRDAQEVWRQEFLDKLAKDEEERTASQYLTVVGWLKLDESDQLKIFDSISSEALECPGTSDWITKNQKLASWLRARNETCFLVLHGPPGTGKSVIASRIATFLRSSAASSVITHFCTYSHRISVEHEQVLRSILAQLICHHTDLIAHAYEELIARKRTPTSQTLESLIRDLMISAAHSPSTPRCIHIIIDGLNECDDAQQTKVVKALERIVSAVSRSGSTICKVLLCTQLGPTQSIEQRLSQRPKVSLSEEKAVMTRAIRQYCSWRLERLSGRLRQIGITDDDLQELANRVATKADGMFLWARLVLDYLSKNIFFSRDEILQAAGVLPRKLSEFYGQILSEIMKSLNERSVARIKLILGWIAFAKRPLKKAEFRSALAFSGGNTAVSELPPPYIFEVCAPLVEERSDSSFAFIHVSVKEYLQSSASYLKLDEQVEYYKHGISLSTCLLSGLENMATLPVAKADRDMRIIRGLHAFHAYATEHWAEYLLRLSTSPNGIDTDSEFFSVSNKLAVALNRLSPMTASPQQTVALHDTSAVPDQRLVSLQLHSALHSAVAGSMLDLAAGHLNLSTAREENLEPSSNVTGLKSLLDCYKNIIKELLAMRTFAGVDLPAFERFKVDFRTTAYACRMLLCPRASAGFDSEEQLLEHEASHLRIICKVAGCQYPTFSSKQALAQHQAKFHPTDTATPRLKAIRRLQSRLAPSMSLRESYQSHKETGRELVGQAPGLDEPRLSASREIDMAGLPAKADQKEVNRYAHRITEAILNLSKHYHGQEDIGALWFELRQAIQEPRLAHLTDPSLWEPVRRVFLESSFEAACWTALVDLVCKRLTHPPDLIAFLKSLSRALPNYEENRAIWGALLIGLPPAARLDPQLWQLLGGRMKLETRTNFGVLGLGFLISCIPKDNRQVPMLCEAIKTGIPELSSYTARLMNHLGNRDAVVIVIDDSDDEMSSDPATQPSNSERRDAGPETSTNKEYGDLRAVIDQAEAIWKKYQCEVEPKLPLLNKFSGKAKNVPNMDQASDGSGSASNMTTNSHLQNGEPSSGSEPDPIGRNIDTSRETTDWLRRWAAKQERSSDAHAGLCTLSEELEKAPRDVKETVLFWGRLGAQAVRLPASCHLPASWIALCYRAVPDEATKNEQFWTMFFLSLPRIQHPVAGVWKALLDEVRNHRDLWDERFWREIGRKIPNNQATFTVWVDVFAAVLNHTRSHPALWDAFERGVPAMADLVEAIKDVLVIRNLVSTTP